MRINSTSSQSHRSFFIYTAIRTEILNEMIIHDKEIEKIIDDFSSSIEWIPPTDGSVVITKKNQINPLLNIIGERIFISRLLQECKEDSSNTTRIMKDLGVRSDKEFFFDDLYRFTRSKLSNAHTLNAIEDFFPKKSSPARSISWESYIINKTWGRPRDVVRLFTIIQKKFPDAKRFEEGHFSATAIEYAKASWRDLKSELRLAYNGDTVKKIYHVLYNMNYGFTSGYFEACLKDDRIDAMDILKKLYIVGVIGVKIPNCNIKYYHTTKKDIVPHQKARTQYVLHDALLPLFKE